ncbi:MAG: MFS transporter [Anaerolineales bacterium]
MEARTHRQALTATEKWLAFTGLGLGVFMATLDASIVNISLPTLEAEFDTTFAIIQWVILSYSLVVTSLILSAGRLGDMLDKKKIYLTGVVLFTLGSLTCGMAGSVGQLIAFRALQGIGATMMQALGMAQITEVFPAEERGKALGLMGSIVSLGIGFGPPLGGLLIGLVGWRAVFLVNVPVGMVTAWMVSRYVPHSVPHQGKQHFDIAGAVVMFLTLSIYALGMTLGQQNGFGSSLTRVLLGLALIGLIIFIAIERRAKQPMVDLSLFRNVLFSLNLLMGFLVFLVMSVVVILPFFLELVKGYSPQFVGLLMMAQPVAAGVVAPLAGSLSDRYGSRGISLIGLLFIIAGFLLMGTLHQNVTPLGYVLRIIPVGIGFGFFQAPNNSAVMGSAPRQRLGIASGLLSLSRTLGQTSGLPLMSAIFAIHVLNSAGLSAGVDVTTAAPAALVEGVGRTYRTGALSIVVATLLAVAALWIDARRRRLAEQRLAE